MNSISNNNIAQAIYLSIRDKSRDEQTLLYPKIVNFLARRHLLSKAGDILTSLNKVINEDEGVVEAKVYSMISLDSTTQDKLTHSLSRHYSNKKVKVVEILDKKLLGGFRVEVDDEVIDFSMKNKIMKLQAHLINKS